MDKTLKTPLIVTDKNLMNKLEITIEADGKYLYRKVLNLGELVYQDQQLLSKGLEREDLINKVVTDLALLEKTNNAHDSRNKGAYRLDFCGHLRLQLLKFKLKFFKVLDQLLFNKSKTSSLEVFNSLKMKK